VAAGVYLVRAAAGDLLTTRKVMLLH
jgi:hypothetical protein